jgi:putative transposase
VYNTEYHIVLTPRYRREIFVTGVKQYLEKVLMHLDGIDADIEVIQANVQLDHVHMVAIIPPRLAVASVIQFIKSTTGKLMPERFPSIKKAIRNGGIWSRGYCVSTVGLNEKAIIDYVKHQDHDDRGAIQLDLGL